MYLLFYTNYCVPEHSKEKGKEKEKPNNLKSYTQSFKPEKMGFNIINIKYFFHDLKHFFLFSVDIIEH